MAFPDGYPKEEFLSLDFIERAQDFAFYGSCGLGKTYLSIALGIMCTQGGYKVCYYQTADLVLRLRAANGAGKPESTLKDIRSADLLILDEFGYIPIDSEGAYLLYQVMSQTYESKSLIVTTNIEFSKWGAVLADEKLAKATADRIVHHGRLIGFTGQSKRLDNSLMMGKPER